MSTNKNNFCSGRAGKKGCAISFCGPQELWTVHFVVVTMLKAGQAVDPEVKRIARENKWVGKGANY